MEGRGSLRQLHQQLAGASYAPNPYGAVQDWHVSSSSTSSSGYEKRAPPPLPTLPPWAANPLSNSMYQNQQQQQYQHPPQQQYQQQQYAPMQISSSNSSGRSRNSYSREEIDPASASSSSGFGKEQQQPDTGGGWRKAPSYFGSMKRLPLNKSMEQGSFPQNVALRQQLPGLRPNAHDVEDYASMSPLHKEQQLLPQEPQDTLQPQFPQYQSVKNQQQEAEEELGGKPQAVLAASRSLSPVRQQHNSESEDPAPEEAPSIDQTFSDPKDEATNQAEEENHHRHQHQFQDKVDSLHSATAVVVQQSGFFRPWKKCPPNEDDNNNSVNESGDESGEYSTSSSQVNKWKVRALLNPFARRGGGGSKQPGTKPFSRFNNAAVTSSEPKDDEDPASRDDCQQPPPPAITAAIGAPRRPTTPVPAPSSLSLASVRPPSNHRSRGQLHEQDPVPPTDNDGDDKLLHAFSGNLSEDRSLTKPSLPPPFTRRTNTKAQTPTQNPSPQPPPQRENYYNREEREDFQSFKAPAKQSKPQASSTARESKPLAQQQPPPQHQQHAMRETKQQHAAVAKAKPKGSVLNALAEIQRKRDERRAQQAEEKQRIQTELEEHGDDAGYKFRRLIQKYRDALPAFQKQEKKPAGAAALPAIAKPSAAAGSTAQAAASTSRLSVFVRKRPLSKKELKAKGYDIVSCLYLVVAAAGQGKAKTTAAAVLESFRRQELILHEPKLKVDCSESLEHHQFRFDGVFDELQDNSQVYACSVGPLIPYLIHDRILEMQSGNHSNLTVFAYGQTGSGKTYTMKSIYRQAASDLFERIEACCGGSGDGNGSSPVLVGVSFYEIYMNNVNDLLNDRSRLQLMEDGEGTVQLLGLKEIMIASADELLDLVKHSEDSRATSANAVHDDSSRSHALLRITLYPNTSENSSTILARLSMVDLAGSERACDTQSDNKNTRMEGAEINKSLLALKECVRALDRGAGHIPFRQSKLTQLLRDSFLSESSKTVMIATVSPWSESCNHTLNTLRYADRLKEIGGV